MTTKGNTGRVIRLDDETWEAYGELCAEKGIARAADVRMYIKREVATWQAEKRRQKREEQRNAAA